MGAILQHLRGTLLIYNHFYQVISLAGHSLRSRAICLHVVPPSTPYPGRLLRAGAQAPGQVPRVPWIPLVSRARPQWEDMIGETACCSPFLITASLIESQVVFVLSSNPWGPCCLHEWLSVEWQLQMCDVLFVPILTKWRSLATDFLLNTWPGSYSKKLVFSLQRIIWNIERNPSVTGPWSYGMLEPWNFRVFESQRVSHLLLWYSWDGELCTLWGSPFPAQTTGCWKDLPYSLSSNLHFTDAESSGIATLERQLERETAGGTRICRDSHCLFFCQVKSVAIHWDLLWAWACAGSYRKDKRRF